MDQSDCTESRGDALILIHANIKYSMHIQCNINDSNDAQVMKLINWRESNVMGSACACAGGRDTRIISSIIILSCYEIPFFVIKKLFYQEKFLINSKKIICNPKHQASNEHQKQTNQIKNWFHLKFNHKNNGTALHCIQLLAFDCILLEFTL